MVSRISLNNAQNNIASNFESNDNERYVLSACRVRGCIVFICHLCLCCSRRHVMVRLLLLWLAGGWQVAWQAPEGERANTPDTQSMRYASESAAMRR